MCEFKIIYKNQEFTCDGAFCLRERVFTDGLYETAVRTLKGVNIDEAEKFAHVEGDCHPDIPNPL